MKLTDEDFDVFTEILYLSFRKLGVKEGEMKELIENIESTRVNILCKWNPPFLYKQKKIRSWNSNLN